jgi:hypothetical protein
MALLRDTRTTPPGGWRYVQPETECAMQAATLGELTGLVQAHRIYKGLDPRGLGEISADIQRQICARLGASFSRPEPAEAAA